MFFRDLFNPSFNQFVTKRVASVFWVLFLVLVALSVIGGWLFLMLSAGSVSDMPFQSKVIWVFSWLLIPLIAFLVVVGARLSFEAAIALTVIAQNTSQAKNQVLSSGAKSSSREWASQQLTENESEVLIEDFSADASAFARDVLGAEGYHLWIKEGSPDLKPWIRGGMPDFERWLSGH